MLRDEQVARQSEKGYQAVTLAGQLTRYVSRRSVPLPRKLYNILLLDLFPEPAAIGNVWENKLALVKSERVGAIVATER